MSDSQRSWSGVRGWLDDKSSQLSRRLVPRVRRNSNRNLSNVGKSVPSLPAERQPSRDSPPKENAQPPVMPPRNSVWRMSSSSKFNSRENTDARALDERSRYSRSKPSRASSVIEPESRPTPRTSKRHSDQQTFTLKSASSRVDDVDNKLSRRRSNTNEPLLVQNRKVTSDRQERGEAKTYSDDVRRRTRGIEPSRPPYADKPPASRGRSTQGSAGDTLALENTVDRDINDARDPSEDMGNTLGPPRSSMSRRSSARPESIGQPHTTGKLVKRRSSHGEHYRPDDLARQMKELKVDQGDSRGRIISRGRSRSRSRSRDPLSTGRRPSRRVEDGAALRDEKPRGRSLSRGSRFSSKSRSVDQRNQRIDPHIESQSRGHTERRGSITNYAPGDPSQPQISMTRDGHIVREDRNGASNTDTLVRQRAHSRSPSRNSVHSRRRLSRTPSRGSLHQKPTDVPTNQHDARVRRPSNASDHAQIGPTLIRDPGSRGSMMMMMRPGSSTRSTAGDTHAPTTTTSHSSSRHLTNGGTQEYNADAETEARRRRRNSTTSITEDGTRISPTADPRATGARGILRRTGRSSTFTDGFPPRVPPASSKIRPQPKIRRSSRSASRSPGRGGPSDDELRSNTMHNARNLKYQPHRDGYPSSTSPSSSRHRPGLVPVRYPISNGPPPRVEGHLPLRRYTTSSVGSIPPISISMPRRPSYTADYHSLPMPPGAGAGDWHPGISPTHEYYTDPYGYGAFPGSYPGSVPPSHAQYPSWPPDMRGAFPPRRDSVGAYMIPSSSRIG